MCSLPSLECREDKVSFGFVVDSYVAAHEYQSVWQAVLDKELRCVREVKNCSDVFLVAVVRTGETVRYPALVSQASLACDTNTQFALAMFWRNEGGKYAR